MPIGGQPQDELPPLPDAPDVPAAVPTTEAAAEQPFSLWSEVLEVLRGTCPPMYGVLRSSTALLSPEGKLILCTDNAMFKELFGMGNNKDLLKEAVQRATGATYRIVLRRSETVTKAVANDPLTSLLTAGKAAGVPINETE